MGSFFKVSKSEGGVALGWGALLAVVLVANGAGAGGRVLPGAGYIADFVRAK